MATWSRTDGCKLAQPAPGSITKVYDEAGYLVAAVNFSDVMLDHSHQLAISDPPTEEPGVMRPG
ncbi:hypothetical protein EB232_31875 [Mesorhizobium sp. NZP2077]|nr:hypothetical protein EB232_31875 [Mesorhizobium sp. NZP2077]